MTRSFFPIVLTAAATLGLSCASTSGARNEPPPTTATTSAQGPGTGPQSMGQDTGGHGMMGGGQGMGPMGDTCPMHVQGTTVTANDVDGGVALDFKTTGDVTELRQRAHRMADMQNQRGSGMMMGGPSGQGGMMGGGHGMGGQKGMMPAATATAEDIEGGARVVLRPKDPAQLEALRTHEHMRTSRMTGGECPMMADSQGATTPPPTTSGANNEAAQPAQ